MSNWIANLLTNGDPQSLQAVRITLVYCQIGIYSFFVLSLLSIWFYYYKKRKNFEDIGLIYLSLFFLFLIIDSAIALYAGISYRPNPNINTPVPIYYPKFIVPTLYSHSPADLASTFLSCLNSFFLLISFTQFDIVKSKKIKFISTNQWLLIATVLFLADVVASFALKSLPTTSLLVSKIPDFIFSLLLFAILGYLLTRSFQFRNANALSVVSFLVCLSIVGTQIFWLNIPEPNGNALEYFAPRVLFNFLSLVLTSALGTLFLALAFTWVFEQEKQEEIDTLQEGKALLQNQIKEKNTILETLKTFENGFSGATQKIAELEKERLILEEKLKEVERSPLSRLSKTEIRFVKLIKDGKTNSEIYKIMSIGVDGANSHRKNISNKIGIEPKKLNEYIKKIDLDALNA